MQAISDKHVVLIGAGGNIGSHIVPHLGRLAGIGRVTLIDRDRYESGNLATQDIVPRDVGRAKARVQAGRLRRINPHLEVRAIVGPVEDVPYGDLRCDVILTGLDSRRARQVVNERALHLGIPWIDGGVDGTQRLSRITIYIPGHNRPCLECGWDDRDYEAVEQTFPCQDGHTEAPGSIAASYLGGITAALLVNEGHKLLAGEYHRVAVGRQVLMDISHHNYYVSTLRPNPACRLAPHDIPVAGEIERCSMATSLGALFDETGGNALQVLGQRFRTQLTCAQCGRRRPALRLEAAARSAPRPCRHCGGPVTPTGFDHTDRLHLAVLSSRSLVRSLGGIGIRAHDVIRVEDTAGKNKYLEIRHGSMARKRHSASGRTK